MRSLVDRAFDRIFRVEELDPEDPQINFCVSFGRHRGRPITLSCGTEVRRGDHIAELHQKNEVLADLHTQYDNPRRLGLVYARMMQESVRALARAWRDDPRFKDTVAVHGTNLFPKLAVMAGFDSLEVRPAWRRRLLSWWIRRIVIAAHPKGRERVIKGGKLLEVRDLWMSRQTCISRHGNRDATSDATKYFRDTESGQA